MAYKNIHDTFWTDSKIRKLSKDEKLLLLYLITNPHSHYTGIYYLPGALITVESGVDLKALSKLIAGGFVKYDPEAMIVWVVKMAKYQMAGKSPKLIQGAFRHLESMESFLCGEFETFYEEMLLPI